MIETRNQADLYDISSGEPAGVRRDVWNGDLFEYQKKLLNAIAQEKDNKVRFKYLVEATKVNAIIQDEMNKANFYKNEFESMCSFLETNNLMSEKEEKEKVKDNLGKEHDYTLNKKRSLVKSIPQLRALLK